MIPKIIHQTWRDKDLPPDFARWSETWRALHPAWEYRLYDDQAIGRIIDARAPHYRAVFDALPRMIQRIDFFRYLIVWLDGGLYADMDMIAYRASDSLIENESCVLGVEHYFGPRRQRELGMQRPYQIRNSIFAAAPHHPFLEELLARCGDAAVPGLVSDNGVEDTTGPRMLTRLAFALPPERLGRVKVLPEIVWGAPWQYCSVPLLRRRIHARHAATGTWREQRRGLRVQWRERTKLPNPFPREGPRLGSGG